MDGLYSFARLIMLTPGDDTMLDMIGRSCQAKSAQCLPHLCFGVLLGSNDRTEISVSGSL
jgi:hypothetical protein